MRTLKRILMVLIIAFTFVFVGCNDDLVQVGIIQYVTDGALDDATAGIIEGLKEKGFEDKKNIKITIYNPQADSATLASQVELAVSKSDVIFAIATPVAIVVKNEIEKQESDCQVFFTAVTDPLDAGIISNADNPGGQITGTNDMNPVKKQVDLMQDLFPTVAMNTLTLGVIYTANEVNSAVQVALMKEECQLLGIKVEEQVINTTADIDNAITYLLSRCDAIYLPTDNLVSSNVFTITKQTNLQGIPTICGEASMLDKGGTIAYGVNYKTLGKMTGEMAAKFLAGEVAKAGDIPSTGMAKEDLTLKINLPVASNAGIVITDDLKAQADSLME